MNNYNGYPLGTRALQLPDSLVASRFLDAFGRPERSQTCSCERQQDSSVGQALHLNNGQTLNDKIRAKNSRIETWLGEKIADEEAVRRLFVLALCREPTATETEEVSGAARRGRRRYEDDAPRGAGRSVLVRAGVEGIYVQSLSSTGRNRSCESDAGSSVGILVWRCR